MSLHSLPCTWKFEAAASQPGQKQAQRHLHSGAPGLWHAWQWCLTSIEIPMNCREHWKATYGMEGATWVGKPAVRGARLGGGSCGGGGGGGGVTSQREFCSVFLFCRHTRL